MNGIFLDLSPAPRPDAGPDVSLPEVLEIGEFVRTRLGFEPDENQLAVLRSSARRGILNCSRQWGKSTVLAALAVHRAYSRPGCLVLAASPTQRQSGEFVRKAAGMLERLQIAARGDGTNKNSLLLPNGSRVIGLPGTAATVRGFSKVSLLLIDEAAQVSEELYKALRPMLAYGDGDLWLMSTPYGRRGFFYEAWAHGGSDWFRVSVAATDCTRLSTAFLEGERGEMGPGNFAQEYLCEFVDSGAGVFDLELVEAALDDGIAALEVPAYRRRRG